LPHLACVLLLAQARQALADSRSVLRKPPQFFPGFKPITRQGVGLVSIDQRTQTAATEAFNKSDHFELRNVTARNLGGTVRLTGRVPSYYSKQVAQELVRRLDDVHHVVYEIEVAN
jgi:osmotically-inducible protein OsmY